MSPKKKKSNKSSSDEQSSVGKYVPGAVYVDDPSNRGENFPPLARANQAGVRPQQSATPDATQSLSSAPVQPRVPLKQVATLPRSSSMRQQPHRQQQGSSSSTSVWGSQRQQPHRQQQGSSSSTSVWGSQRQPQPPQQQAASSGPPVPLAPQLGLVLRQAQADTAVTHGTSAAQSSVASTAAVPKQNFKSIPMASYDTTSMAKHYPPGKFTSTIRSTSTHRSRQAPRRDHSRRCRTRVCVSPHGTLHLIKLILCRNNGQKAARSDVRSLEDKVIANISRNYTKDETKLPLRPAFGKKGKAINLLANYVEITTPSGGASDVLRTYDVQFVKYHDNTVSGQPAGRKLRRFVELLIKDHFGQHEHVIATDYSRTLVTHAELQLREDATYKVQYKDDQGSLFPRFDATFTVKAKHPLQYSDLLAYLSAEKTDQKVATYAKEPIVQALNIVLGFHPKTDTTATFSIGANKHFGFAPQTLQAHGLGEGLEALRGYFVSVRLATLRPLLNIQVKYAACLHHGPLVHLMNDLGLGNLPRLHRQLSKVRVEVTYSAEYSTPATPIPRFRTIYGLAKPHAWKDLDHPPIIRKEYGSPHDVDFYNDETKSYISVATFFKHACTVVYGNQTRSKLNGGQSEEMLKFSLQTPAYNASVITSFGLQAMGITPTANKTLADFGIGVGKSLVPAPGRVLSAPVLGYHDRQSARPREKPRLRDITPRNGSWNLSYVKFIDAKPMKKCGVIVVVDEGVPDPQDLGTFRWRIGDC
ncbi:hypothetical protein MRB53_041093 [Persea americana]|nr:hypothetical protein MRB53_041093 [Persea americana]